ncbi:MAG: hypothetical protein ACI8T1_002514 [Verrucomicrobiales bacterium]
MGAISIVDRSAEVGACDDAFGVGLNATRCDVALRGAVMAAIVALMTTGLAIAIVAAAGLRGRVGRRKDGYEGQRASASEEGIE